MKSLFILIMSLIICSFVYPQEDSSKSKYALSFGIADNFMLNRFYMDIAFKKIIDETHHLRLFLSPRLSTSNEEQKAADNSQDQERERINYSLGAGADYLWILLKHEDINMFGGTGLILTYGNRNEKYTSVGTIDIVQNEEKSSYINSGIRGTLGVEWKVTERIGIHSEYLLTGSYNWSKSEISSSVNDVEFPIRTIKASGITLSSGVLFGLSIYL